MELVNYFQYLCHSGVLVAQLDDLCIVHWLFVLIISWWWEPHMSGSEIFGPLLRAGLVNLDQFFCKM